MTTWPVSLADVRAARERLRPYLEPTPVRRYPALDAAVGDGIRVWVKHENFQPTGSFKVRNGLAAMTLLEPADRKRGVVAATRGNHGLGLAWAGERLGIPVTICVPVGNNAEKNEALAGFGVTLIEDGRDYDESLEVAHKLVRERGLKMVHSTNDCGVIAGAGTMTLELIEQAAEIEALVIAVGGGSQAVGALTVARALRPGLPIYAVQARGASAIHDSWHAKRTLPSAEARTIADGLATRTTYELTFGPLCEGLAGFVAVSEWELAEAMRLLLRTTHSLCEAAGAASLAGLLATRRDLAGKRVGVIVSGANVDLATLRQVVSGGVK